MVAVTGWAIALAAVMGGAALASIVLMALAAARCPGRQRQSWLLLAAAATGWLLSRSWHILLELLGPDVPAVAEMAVPGALALVPLCAVAGLLWYPGLRTPDPAGLGRPVTDAASVALALAALSWQLASEAGARSSPGQVDLVVLTTTMTVDLFLVAIVVSQAVRCRPVHRFRLRWLLIGLPAIALSDGSFALALAQAPAAQPAAGLLLGSTLLWFCGYAAVGAAAFGESEAIAEDRVTSSWEALPCQSLAQLAIVTCWVILVARWLGGAPVEQAGIIVVTGLAMVGQVRQFLTLAEARRINAEFRHHQEQLKRSKRCDTLTGLPNRAAFADAIADAVRDRGEDPVTVVLIRPTNSQLLENLAARTADAVVVELATRIGTCLPRQGALLARISDTTFAALLEGDGEIAAEFVRETMIAAEAPVLALNLRLHLSLTAGSVTLPLTDAPQQPPPQDLTQYAAIALGTVATTPGGAAVFTPAMLDEHTQRLQLQQAVAFTLRTEPVTAVNVMFEPVIDLSTGHMIGVATRANWRHRDHTPLTAGRLIALAREAGLADRVDHTVLRTAIDRFSAWRTGWPDICQQLWITVCGDTLTGQESAFPGWLDALLTSTGLPASTLVLDLLDGRPASKAARATLKRLCGMGVRVASSDALALAGSAAGGPGPERAGGEQECCSDFFDISPVLVERCGDDLRARRLVQATVEFATARSSSTTARQVTTIAQHEQLRELGVTVARGPLYGQPMRHQDAERLVAAAAAGTWESPAQRETQRRRSSEAWRELRHVVNRLPIAAFACDREGKLVLAEGALFAHLDLPEDLLDRPLVHLVGTPHPRTGKRPLEQPLRQALRGTPSVTTVSVADTWLQVHLSARRELGGAITGVMGFAIDVTHRIQAEQALRGSERRFREVFDQAPVGIMVIGPDQRVVQANPAIATMLGYAPEELIGSDHSSLWHPDASSEAGEQYAALRAGTVASFTAERAYRHRDGSPVLTRVTAGNLSESAVRGTSLSIVEDLRQVKQLEVELRHAQKLEAVGMLAAGIAHEINTPIQFISDNTNFLAHAFQQITRVLTAATELVPDGDHPARQRLATVSEEADLDWVLEQVPKATTHSLEGVAQVAHIVRAMRNFGHPDQREPSLVDVNGAIQDTAVIAHNEVKHAADLDLELDHDLPNVLGYPSEFNQVILNLLVNAAHAVADRGHRGRIQVKTWSDEEAVFVSVTDDGCGMTAETRARIFDPFFTTKEVGRGTGQGLTIVYNVVVEKHHGTINVESTPGAGTTFTIRIPLPEEEDEVWEFDEAA
ncbi:MAG: PAS domain S-box protein [Micromonosporaceae bacterium]|nr:PAS domain S-box protein [Micromonosporaceae bacterium]